MKRKAAILPYVLLIIFIITTSFTISLAFTEIYESNINTSITNLKKKIIEDDINYENNH